MLHMPQVEMMIECPAQSGLNSPLKLFWLLALQLMQTATFTSTGNGTTTLAVSPTGGLVQADTLIAVSSSTQMGLCEVTLMGTPASSGE